MKNKHKFNIPILFIIFRRKNTALRVIRAIAKVKPRKLYISQDGPRNENEKLEVLATREAILSKIDWDCRVTVWTHDENLGLIKHIPGALDKFFEKEEYGIYLEDDTVPSEDFFYYEKELLEKYKTDKRIFSINATNFFPGLLKIKQSYYLTEIGDIWGMGLWKRSWNLYRPDIKDFSKLSKEEEYKSYFFSRKFRFYLETFCKAVIKGKLNTWDVQLIYAAVKNKMFFIAPKVNLVNNIGLGNKASNISLQTYYKSFGKIFPLLHPKKLIYNKTNDILYFDNLLKGGWLRLWGIKMYLSLK